jgi:tRNA(Ile2) C34 agmatinyltransferase TiaS
MTEEKKKTLDDRIEDLLEKGVEKGHPANAILKEGIKELIERVTFPQYYCPTCDHRMFYEVEKRYFRCINCGYTSQQATQQPTVPGKPLPAAVEQALGNAATAERAIKAPIRKPKPQVSQVDEEMVRLDPKVKGDINWV